MASCYCSNHHRSSRDYTQETAQRPRGHLQAGSEDPETTTRQPGNPQEATRKPQGDTRKLSARRETPDLTTNLVRDTSLVLLSQLQSFMKLPAHVRAWKEDFRLCVRCHSTQSRMLSIRQNVRTFKLSRNSQSNEPSTADMQF